MEYAALLDVRKGLAGEDDFLLKLHIHIMPLQ